MTPDSLEAVQALHLLGAPLPGQVRHKRQRLPLWLRCVQCGPCSSIGPHQSEGTSSNSDDSSESPSPSATRRNAASKQTGQEAQV